MATQKSLSELDVLKKEILASDFEEKNKFSLPQTTEQTPKIKNCEPDHRHPVSKYRNWPERQFMSYLVLNSNYYIKIHYNFFYAISHNFEITFSFIFRSKWKSRTLKSLPANLSPTCLVSPSLRIGSFVMQVSTATHNN